MKNLTNNEINRLADFLIQNGIIKLNLNGYSIGDYNYPRIMKDYINNTKDINIYVKKLTDSTSFLKTRTELIKWLKDWEITYKDYRMD